MLFKAVLYFIIIYFFGGDHNCLCSDITPGFLLKDHSNRDMGTNIAHGLNLGRKVPYLMHHLSSPLEQSILNLVTNV